MNKELLDNIKKTTIFIWSIWQDWKEIFCWTWVLCQINNVYYMITAKHVIWNLDKDWNISSENLWLSIFLNLNTVWKRVKAISIATLKQTGLNYIYHSNPKIDLAIIPIMLDLNTDDIKLVDINAFSLDLEWLYETNDVFTSSFQPWISSLADDWNIKPIIRKGSIARINNDNTYYIDSSAYPWNSWSPVFLLPSAIQYSWGGISLWWDTNWWKIIWIINSYVNYQDVARSDQTWRPRIIFEENTWLSKISSVNLIKEIIEQDNFKKQEKEILENVKK